MFHPTRREALTTGALSLGASALVRAALAQDAAPTGRVVTKGRLKQSVCRWPYAKIALPDFCKAVADMGLTAIDLLREPEWPVARDSGLICSMAYAGSDSIPNGFNNKANHDALVTALEDGIPKAAAFKIPNVITFFGNRRGMADAEAIDNCVEGLSRLKSVAEGSNVTLCVELLNSKVDHKDYQGDHTAFGVQVIKGVNSPRIQLLYDIYHMQIMEGDLIRTIRDNLQYIAHFHTGGVPGRHELDNTQEVNWPAVAGAIADANFPGFMAHEFNPTRDPLTSLREAVTLCDV
jgi:hydroxypyruvate isomerase